jgi:hypothetical protein
LRDTFAAINERVKANQEIISNRMLQIGRLTAFDNLDPIEKARLDRAVQQGFDLDAYHGTKGDIQSFDPGLLGATTGAPSARVGFFFAAEPETAATYARTADLRALNPKGQSIKEQLAALDINDPDYDAKRAQLIEAKKTDRLQGIEKAGKSYDDNIRELEERKRAVAGNVVVDPKSNTLALPAEYQVEYDRLNNELARVRSEREKLEDMGQNILPVKLRLQNPLVHDFGGGSYREVSYRELLDQAQREGKDGAIFRNTRDGGPVTDIYVVFEPSQIRSRFAAFDPKDAPTVGEARQVADRTDLESLRTPIESEIRQLQDEIGQAALGKIAVPPKIVDTSVQEARLAELMEQSFLIAEKKRGVGTGNTGDITATMPPVLFPLGAGTAAVAYSANQESD